MIEGKPARREDALMDKISELIQKREDTLKAIGILGKKHPDMAEVLDELSLHLL